MRERGGVAGWTLPFPGRWGGGVGVCVGDAAPDLSIEAGVVGPSS